MLLLRLRLREDAVVDDEARGEMREGGGDGSGEGGRTLPKRLFMRGVGGACTAICGTGSSGNRCRGNESSGLEALELEDAPGEAGAGSVLLRLRMLGEE